MQYNNSKVFLNLKVLIELVVFCVYSISSPHLTNSIMCFLLHVIQQHLISCML
jgi:hypothetical protein